MSLSRSSGASGSGSRVGSNSDNMALASCKEKEPKHVKRSALHHLIPRSIIRRRYTRLLQEAMCQRIVNAHVLAGTICTLHSFTAKIYHISCRRNEFNSRLLRTVLMWCKVSHTCLFYHKMCNACLKNACDVINITGTCHAG